MSRRLPGAAVAGLACVLAGAVPAESAPSSTEEAFLASAIFCLSGDVARLDGFDEMSDPQTADGFGGYAWKQPGDSTSVMVVVSPGSCIVWRFGIRDEQQARAFISGLPGLKSCSREPRPSAVARWTCFEQVLGGKRRGILLGAPIGDGRDSQQVATVLAVRELGPDQPERATAPMRTR